MSAIMLAVEARRRSLASYWRGYGHGMATAAGLVLIGAGALAVLQLAGAA